MVPFTKVEPIQVFRPTAIDALCGNADIAFPVDLIYYPVNLVHRASLWLLIVLFRMFQQLDGF